MIGKGNAHTVALDDSIAEIASRLRRAADDLDGRRARIHMAPLHADVAAEVLSDLRAMNANIMTDSMVRWASRADGTGEVVEL